MKKVLITGAAGFLGRHFHQHLEEDGWDVYAMDLMPGRGVMAWDAYSYFTKWKDRDHFDLVLHCAAVVGGREVTDRSPLEQAVNLDLDSALFRWALRAKPGRIVYFSSSAVYPVTLQGFDMKLPLREDVIPVLGSPREALFSPDMLYGWGKLTGEYLTRLAWMHGQEVTIVRPFSGYGEDQADCYPFPAFVRHARASADPFTVWGNSRQVRDFVHVDDIVGATLAIAESGTELPVNIGWGRPIELGGLASMICEAAGYKPSWHVDESAPMGVEYRVADVTRMKLFYEPKITLEEGIERALKVQ